MLQGDGGGIFADRAGLGLPGHVGDHDRDRLAARRGPQPLHHRLGGFHALDGDPPAGQRQRHPAASEASSSTRPSPSARAARNSTADAGSGPPVRSSEAAARRSPKNAGSSKLVTPTTKPKHQDAAPLISFDLARQALKLQEDRQAMYRIDMGTTWPETDLVFTTRTGRPVEPRNLVRSFWRICDTNKVRTIKVHHLRHTVGSLLKDLKVPARDAPTILGHTRISTTLKIHTGTDEQARRDALTRLPKIIRSR